MLSLVILLTLTNSSTILLVVAKEDSKKLLIFGDQPVFSDGSFFHVSNICEFSLK